MTDKIVITLIVIVTIVLAVGIILQIKDGNPNNKTTASASLSNSSSMTNPTNIQTVSVEQFYQKINEKNTDIVLVDLRTQQEYSAGHLYGSKNIDFLQSNFNEEINKLEKNKHYFIYCNSGNRSAQASLKMQQQGFNHITDMEGGIQAWKAAQYPIVQ